MTRRPLIALVPGLLAVATAAPAWAYVRAKTDSGIPVYWTSSCVPVTVYVTGFSQLTSDEVAKSIGAAAHAWSPESVICPEASAGVTHPYLEIVPGMAPANAAVPAVAADGHNVIVFRSTGWETDNSSLAVAVTTLTKKGDGRIIDADVEINAEFDSWANLDPGSTIDAGHGQSTPYDLQNAITHEFGHFIGLAHTCFSDFSDSVRPIDDQGDPVPDCGAGAPAAVRGTVMYATISQDSAEVSKRVLAADDIRGVCEIYPAARDPHACTLDLPDDGCGCASEGSRRGRRGWAALSTLAALAALAALVTRDRARRAGRGPTVRRG